MDQAEIDARFVAQWRGLERLLGLLEVGEAAGTVRAANLRFFYLASDVEAAAFLPFLLAGEPSAASAAALAAAASSARQRPPT